MLNTIKTIKYSLDINLEVLQKKNSHYKAKHASLTTGDRPGDRPAKAKCVSHCRRSTSQKSTLSSVLSSDREVDQP